MWSIIADELENALCELSMHPPEMWTEYAPVLMDVLAHDHRIPVEKAGPRFLSRKAYQACVLSREDWY